MNTDTLSLVEFAADYDSYAAAIEAARKQGYTLNTYADPTADGRKDVSDEYAAEAMQSDPALVYLRPAPDTFPGTTEIAARRLEQQRDELRDLAEDEADYRRLCSEAGISPV